MMSFTEVFLLMFCVTSFFLHYVQLTKIKELEKKANQPMNIQIMDVSDYDESELW